MDSINSTKNIAKLQKTLKKGGIGKTDIPLFQNADGSEKSRLETYETIMKDHFPNSRKVSDSDPIAIERRKRIEQAKSVDINSEKLHGLLLMQ